MDVVTDALLWLNDPLNWTGRRGVLALAREHLLISVAAVALAAAAASAVYLVSGRTEVLAARGEDTDAEDTGDPHATDA